MKPHVICHMASSLDGRTVPSRWTPRDAHDNDRYDALHAELGGGSWLVGRVTGQEFAQDASYPVSRETFPRASWLPAKADAYAVVLDGHGKIAWGRADVGGDPLVIVLTEQVSDRHLAELRSDGVGYLFAGESEIDLPLALEKLGSELGIDRLLLEGGGTINGAFLRAGLVDEVSLLLEPAIDGRAGAPSVFDGDSQAANAPLSALTLTEHRPLGDSAIWLRYMVERPDSSD